MKIRLLLVAVAVMAVVLALGSTSLCGAEEGDGLARKASTILDGKLRAALTGKGKSDFYLGKCGFSDDLKYAQIYFDEVVWHSIAVKGDEDTKRTYWKFMFKAVREAAHEASGDSSLHPYFHLMSSEGKVMFRGIIINGEEMPNYVEPEHWIR